MNSYLKSHKHLYVPEPSGSSQVGLRRYKSVNGWVDCYIGQHFIFSDRSTDYDNNNFPERFHSHDFYEMDIYRVGNIKYVSDHQEIVPQPCDILIFPPGCNHTAKLISESKYERFVFYFSSRFFTDIDRGFLPKLFCDDHVSCRVIQQHYRGVFFYLLENLKEISDSNSTDASLLAYSYLFQLLHLVANHTNSSQHVVAIPQKILDIKNFIDERFASIETINDVASHFFYSREYVSRVFRLYYNITISEYLRNKRVSYATALLSRGYSVGKACDAAGFHSMSAFVNAFRIKHGITPAQYKHLYREEKNENSTLPWG